jgi:Tol biopolymer transport system component
MRSDGSEFRALTTDVRGVNRLPRWSADGKSILFYSDHNEHRCCEIWSIGADGSGMRKLTETGNRASYALPTHTGSCALALKWQEGFFEFDYEKPFASQQVRYLAGYSNSKMQLWIRDWSPDDKLVVGVLAADDDSAGMFSFSPDTKQFQKISAIGSMARFLPDGKRLVLIDQTGRLQLTGTDGREPEAIWSLAPDRLSFLAFSRDGHWLYFDRTVEDGDVWMAEME